MIGIQGDYTWSGITTTASVFGDVCYESPIGPDSCDGPVPSVDDTPTIAYELDTDDSWTVMGRAGILANAKTLIYGLAGYTHTDLEGRLTLTSLPTGSVPLASYSFDRDGTTFGAGMETLLNENLSAKLEYRNTTWSEDSTLGDDVSGVRFEEDSMVQTIRGVLSWRLHLGG